MNSKRWGYYVIIPLLLFPYKKFTRPPPWSAPGSSEPLDALAICKGGGAGYDTGYKFTTEYVCVILKCAYASSLKFS